jgi:multiple sugar transport system substrate-binding protein
VNWTDFPTKVQTLIQNKQFPDILEGDTAPQFAQSHLLYRSSGVLSASVLGDIMPKFLKDTDYQGTAYGIPFTTSTRALYYNKKIFAAAGITSPPSTWAQLQRTRPRSKPRDSSAMVCRSAAKKPRPRLAAPATANREPVCPTARL